MGYSRREYDQVRRVWETKTKQELEQTVRKAQISGFSSVDMKLINCFTTLGLTCSMVRAEILPPATYNIDASAIQPVVSLCNANAARVRTDGKVDLCITIYPPSEDKPPKSYTCDSLPLTRLTHDRFAVVEEKSNCMTRMHDFANAVGISIETPIEFTTWYGPDISGIYSSAGTLSFHLKWSQQSRPFAAKGLGSPSGVVSTSPTTVIVAVAVVAFLF